MAVFTEFFGRSSRIRTYDLCLPKAALYQAELYSDALGLRPNGDALYGSIGGMQALPVIGFFPAIVRLGSGLPVDRQVSQFGHGVSVNAGRQGVQFG